MTPRRLLLAAALLAPLAPFRPAVAAPPAVQLLVELRWVDSQLPPAAQAGVRDGAVVIGTAGSVSPRGPGVVTSTAAAAPQPAQRLLVLNGHRAGLRLTTREPLQWVDAVVEIDPAASAAGPASAPRRIYASPRQGERRRTQSFVVTPTWPGGRAPVRIEFDIDDGDSAFQSTLDLPMERWQTVARSGGGMAPAPRGTLSSADAAGHPERELQLRVSVQP
ncbi:hypothetical protein [Roseateles saccharophilus]|uniref:Uncharacterized protein n=1 Tax=Roseateles saccharophilus TaxID=304 RepID=A0A4R3V1H1_ROSSA|nr:hypothetical protein [Roseateles saccharophilus]MDG0831924.1 hypothetical protein [Roseateles saccharophilus]TCU97410.1 hypothetical protein EV671_101185 [Roseateles saccharophilus]